MKPRACGIGARGLIGSALFALGLAACGGPATVASDGEPAGPVAEPERFSLDRFEANLRTLVALGARPAASEALASAREWALAHSPPPAAAAPIALVASLEAPAARGSALAEASSGAALVLEVARALAARGQAVTLAFVADGVVPDQALANAEAAVYVARACGLPERRDLLSHHVLRERFFRAAGTQPVGFEQVDAPHGALHAAGARRVVALDAPAAPGAPCQPAGLAEALLHFVSDATALLSRNHDK